MNKEEDYAINSDYWASGKVIKELKDLQQRIDKAIELLKDDYFEDGSGNNIDKVLEILEGKYDE